jgi:trans-aconitate methyltransferase
MVYTLMMLFLLLAGCSLFIVASLVFWTVKNGISPMPTAPRAKHAIISVLPAVNGSVYELGSGWGTLVFPLADHYPNCQVTGIESSPIPYWVSRLQQLFYSYPNLAIERADFFHYDLSGAQLIVCYLYPEAMRQLKYKFQKELQPGAWVVSNTFAIPGWIPEKVVTLDDLYHTKVYLYHLDSVVMR